MNVKGVLKRWSCRPLSVRPVVRPIFAALMVAATAVIAIPPALGMPETGMPRMQVFTDDDYGAARQNWALTEDQRGVIYVGNVDGVVLSFDGARWRSTPVADSATVRSLATDPDGRVYVGTVGNFGYLGSDENGRRQFVSLLDRVPPQQREFADVWSIFTVDDAVYFSAFAGLFRIADDEVQVWEPDTSFHLSFQIGERIFVREVGRGLHELVDDQLRLVPDGEHFADERIYVMLPWGDVGDHPDEAILIGTREGGWYVHDGSGLQRWKTELDRFLPEDLLYHAVRLDEIGLAVATLRGGISLLDHEGRLLRRITRDQGLPDNAVFRLHADRLGGLWLALNNGIVRLMPGSRVTRFDHSLGLSGEVLAVERHGGHFFAATTDGLYRMTHEDGGVAHFAAVDEIRGQTWDLLSLDDGLLISSLEGVYEWRDGEVSMVRPSAQTSFALLRSRNDPNRVWIGMHTGLASIYRDAVGDWIDEGRLPGLEDEVRTLYETADGTLWLGTWYRGALRLQDRPDAAPDDSVWQRLSAPQRIGIVEEPEEYVLTYVHPIDGQLRFGSHRGLFRFDAERGGLVTDPRFVDPFADGPPRIFPFHQDEQGRVWMYTADVERGLSQLVVAQPTGDGDYRLDAELAAPLFGMTVQSLHSEDDGIVWVGADNALFRLDTTMPAAREQHFRTLIRGVYERDSGGVLYGGDGPPPSLQLDYTDNTLRFEYAAPSFERFDATRYRVMLEGLDRDWSAWSAESFRDYTHMREGRYRFRVQARNVYGVSGREAVIDFRILPPWYRSAWAYTVYITGAMLLMAGGFRWRSAVLRRRNRQLRRLVAERTRELSEANGALAEQSRTDPLTGLRNRRYLAEQVPSDIAVVTRRYRDSNIDNADLMFLMVDIDHFKNVNDHHGHDAGDRVLQQMSGILLSGTRETDTVVRWGGEEFLVLARYTDADFAPVLAERLRRAVSTHDFNLGGGRSLTLTCSLGFAQFPLFPQYPDRVDWEKVVNVADHCLYAAKHSWRDAWVGVRCASVTPPPEDLRGVARRLPELIRNGSLEVLTSRPDDPDGLSWSTG